MARSGADQICGIGINIGERVTQLPKQPDTVETIQCGVVAATSSAGIARRRE